MCLASWCDDFGLHLFGVEGKQALVVESGDHEAVGVGFEVANFLHVLLAKQCVLVVKLGEGTVLIFELLSFGEDLIFLAVGDE
jgi:hypothetical protein